MENKHTPKLPLRISEKNECSICDSNGDFIIETFETETAKFIVTACNNYQALKEENEELKAAIKEAAIWIEEEADALMDTPQKGVAAIMYMRLAPLTEILTKHSK